MTVTQGADAAHAAVGPDNNIWYARRGREPLCVGMDVEALAGLLSLGGVRSRLRVVGSAANAGLVVAAAGLHEAGRLDLEVGGPLLAESDRRPDAAGRLARVAAASAAPSASAGGWHRFDRAELAPYEAAAALAAGASGESLAAILAGYPAYRRLLFVSPCDQVALAELMARLRDPRWYVDPDCPDRLARLYDYCGKSGKRVAAEADARGDLVRRIWHRPDAILIGAAGRPRGFLARLYYSSERETPLAIRAADRCLLRFVQSVWLDRLRPENPHGDLFVPEQFFARALGRDSGHREVAEAYRRFVEEVG